MPRVLSLLLFLLLAAPALASPQAAVASCYRHVVDIARTGYPTENLRYLYHPGGFSEEDYAIACLHLNLLSREGEIILPRRLNAEVIVFGLSEYAMNPVVYEKLAILDPYFHEVLIVPPGQTAARRYYRGDKQFKAGWYDTVPKSAQEQRFPIPARWLISEEMNRLILLTNSVTPVLRWDWFFNQTSVCEDRQTSYYEFLELKNRNDFDKLAGLDKVLAISRRKNQQAYLIQSGVAINNRQIEWFKTFDGNYWVTKDSFKNTGRNNAVRLLNGDYEHDAEEIYGTLPNGLPLMAASDAKGNLQRVVPSKIATDGSATSNDRNIHVPLGCMRCHVEVIRPFNCDARRLYRGEILLDVIDPLRVARLQSLYLSDIDTTIKKSQEAYAEAFKKASGFTTAQAARAYGNVYRRYAEVPLDAGQAALELGITEERMLAVIGERIKKRLSDPVLSGLYQKPSIPIRREHWEELQGVIHTWLGY